MTLSGACKGNYSAPERSIAGYPRASWQVPPVVVGTAAGRDAYAICGLSADQRQLRLESSRWAYHPPLAASEVSSVSGIFQAPPTPSTPPRLRDFIRSTDPSLN